MHMVETMNRTNSSKNLLRRLSRLGLLFVAIVVYNTVQENALVAQPLVPQKTSNTSNYLISNSDNSSSAERLGPVVSSSQFTELGNRPEVLVSDPFDASKTSETNQDSTEIPTNAPPESLTPISGVYISAPHQNEGDVAGSTMIVPNPVQGSESYFAGANPSEFSSPPIPVGASAAEFGQPVYDGEYVGESQVIETEVQPVGRPGGLFNQVNRNERGKYVSVLGGWVYPVTTSAGFNARNPETGGSILASFGNKRSSRFRTEWEFGYRTNELTSNYGYIYPYTVVSEDYLLPYPYGGKGEINTYSAMFNGYLDFDRAPNRFITPYAGVGIGIAFLDAEFQPAYTFGTKESFSDSAFAFQAIAGVATKLTAKLDYLLEYRYFTTVGEDDLCQEVFNRYGGACDYEVSNLFMGLRWRF